MQCNLLNEQLPDEEWIIIEKKCRYQKHLGQDENLKNLIIEDEKIMENHNITFVQLKNFFDKIKYHADAHTYENEVVFNEQYINIVKSLNLGSPKWCLWGRMIFPIFNNKIHVIQIVWGGAELCPFRSPEDKKYRGYEYGSIDWVFIKCDTGEYMHIGDLLFHQISKHHFFQSKCSKYRVEPEKLINFFNLKEGVDYSTEVHAREEYVYSSAEYTGKLDERIMESCKEKIQDIIESHPNHELIDLHPNKIYNCGDTIYLIVTDVDSLKIPDSLNGIKINFGSDCHNFGYYESVKQVKKTPTVAELGKDWI